MIKYYKTDLEAVRVSKKIGIITLGCKVNQYESEAFAEALRERGYEVCDGNTACDGYIINTCTVTAEADRKSRQMIRRAARMQEGAVVVITGCTAEYSAEELSKIEGVIGVCGNSKKLECVDIIDNYFKNTENKQTVVSVPPIEEAEFEKMHLSGFPRTRVYIKIEDGCENKCAYCAIPKARGHVRSKAPEDILREVKGFIDEGVKEIVLTGIETASYGKDLNGIRLGFLLKLVDAIAGNCKIRLGSLDPSLFKEGFVNEIKDLKSLAPHFHISLQSGSSKVLALMRRKYNADGARAAMQRIRGAIPNVMFTTDIIVGFPGESDEDFLETVEFVKEARFLSAHIFPYSEREGTIAADMPDKVPVELRRKRAAKLIEIQNSIRSEILDEEIKRQPERDVLFETYSNGIAHGHTDSFLEVSVEAPEDLHGAVHKVNLTHHDGNVCFGTLLDYSEKKCEKAVAKPSRKIGVVSGFRTCDSSYLSRINEDLKLDASREQMSALQNLFVSLRRDPTVAELYFMLAGLRRAQRNAEENAFIESVEIPDTAIGDMLSEFVRRYGLEAGTGDTPPILTKIADYAATGKGKQDYCGIEICKSDLRTMPVAYSGKSETVIADSLALTLSAGKPISGDKTGSICAVIAPKDCGNIDEFIPVAHEICRRFLKEYPETKISASACGGLFSDLSCMTDGLLIDTSLLPNPSPYADALFEPIIPAVMIFAERDALTRLWQIAAEYGITPCAPVASAKKNVTVKAAEGTVEFDRKILNQLNFNSALRMKCSGDAVIDDTGEVMFDSGSEHRLALSPHILTAKKVGGDNLYEDLAAAFEDTNAVYAVGGLLDPRDPAVLPALLTLDAFRRNFSPNIMYSKFFIGEKTSICIFKLKDRK